MMTLREQLEDPIFRKWIALEPHENKTAAVSPPWYVYVQFKQDGPWKRAEFRKWKKGYKYLTKMLKNPEVFDCALSHKRQQFRPPVVRQGGKRRYHFPPNSEMDTIWCGYCRRMTRFTWFSKHHAFPKNLGVNRGDRRCCICGNRLESITRYH